MAARLLQQPFRLALRNSSLVGRSLVGTPPVITSKAFPAIAAHVQRTAGFHHHSTLFNAVSATTVVDEDDKEGQKAKEEELPTRFDQIQSLHPKTAKAIKSVFKYETMSKVQSEVLSLLPTDKDMFVKAKTGTGKTLGFLIPALETVVSQVDKKTLAAGDQTTVLIVSPTRELAQQIADEAKKLCSTHRFNVHCLVGGESKRMQIRNLNTKRIDLVVGTPGRLNDMIESVKEFRDSLQGTKVLILDECDQLLDMGFKDSIESIVEALPKERQTLFFSATVSPEIKKIARKSLKDDFAFIDTVDPNEANTNLQIQQSYTITSYEKQLPLLARLLEDHKRANPRGKIMVFLPTTRSTQLYSALFEDVASYRIFSLHSKKSQESRTRTSDRFRKSNGGVLFTSDVSARGVDYPDVSLVVQVGMPSSKEQYIHRVGRTGRAGKTGQGVIMLTPFERDFLKSMSDLPLQEDTIMEQVDEVESDARLMARLDEAKQRLDPDLLNDSFTAFLGYYVGRTDVLQCPRRDILDSAKKFVTSLGMEEPPHLSPTFLSKLGLTERGGGSGRGGRGGRNFGGRDRDYGSRGGRFSDWRDDDRRRGRNFSRGGGGRRYGSYEEGEGDSDFGSSFSSRRSSSSFGRRGDGEDGGDSDQAPPARRMDRGRDHGRDRDFNRERRSDKAGRGDRFSDRFFSEE
ncbi:hypothetical protein DFQ27_009312 [Actinomortierella ambigua]|uniref:ATP-dependent RNA helicase n=1 Tax=Actinomortierella ambigua TaxID=1343610 RepID=A0A9P6QEP1_9FUNG|nr:hypothetical protein DFQ27_009312 [Actinomortierella ambigua]